MRSLKFLNRTQELEKLRSFSRLSEPSLAIIYGRRRCGKSRLLQEFSGPHDLYFLADKQDPRLQRERLAQDIAFRFEGFDQVQYPSWESILINVDGRMPKGSCLILDEFPYLAATSPELTSVIQRLLDKKRLKNMHLILCGSSQRMMLNLAMGAAEPLYGRSQLLLKLRPLEWGWIAKAFPFDASGCVETYATLGGTPRYWELAREHETLEDIIKTLILDRDGILHDEMRRLLLDDLNDSSLAISLLSLIGNGCHRLSEIAARIGKPSTQMTRPLANLVELDYVRRETPWAENEKKSKRGIYKISDPYLRFLFRFVEPYGSRLEMGDSNGVYTEISNALPHHVGSVWEDIARNSTSWMEIAGLQWQPAKRWWRGSNDHKIDIVCESLDGKHVLVGEAKWSSPSNLERIQFRLQQYSEQLPIRTDQKLHFALWSKLKAGKRGNLHLISPTSVINSLV